MIKSCVCLPENVGCIPMFSGMHMYITLIISDLYRLLTEIAEVLKIPAMFKLGLGGFAP